MKMIVAMLKPYKLDEVREALGPVGVAELTVTAVQGFGQQKGQTEIYRGAEYKSNLLPKVKIEIATTDALAPKVVETIRRVANSDAIGDGKIFVFDLGSATRIRTNEVGDDAL
ncbi:MAG: P-II family nitrogen regulator [Polaromonas sp.]